MARPKSDSENVAACGEDALVRRLIRGLPQSARTLHGPGDDCAVIDPGSGQLLLLKTDCVISGVHFTPETSAVLVGQKALNRAVSDIAVMGGSPREALVTIALPRTTPVKWVERLYTGLKAAACVSGCGIAGGETSSLPDSSPVVISVAMTGEVERENLVLRSTARAGDSIMVTGVLGGSFASGHHLNFTPRLAEAQWLARNLRPTAMMDLSDGLAKDLPRLADASGLGFEIFPALVPCRDGCTLDQALSDGEDYELLFTLPGKMPATELLRFMDAFRGTSWRCIGRMLSRKTQRTPLSGGWDHFRA
jgi:thiamine-monophosphate kinase